MFVLGLEDLEREYARAVGGEPRSLTEVLRSFRRAEDLPQGSAIPGGSDGSSPCPSHRGQSSVFLTACVLFCLLIVTAVLAHLSAGLRYKGVLHRWHNVQMLG